MSFTILAEKVISLSRKSWRIGTCKNLLVIVADWSKVGSNEVEREKTERERERKNNLEKDEEKALLRSLLHHFGSAHKEVLSSVLKLL